MEELRDSPLKEKFRFLLIHIGSELHTRNCKDLKFGLKINPCRREEDEDGLDILSELMKKGKFDAYNPDKLQSILEMIGRKDLSDVVKEYKKSALFKEETKIKKKDSLRRRAESLAQHSTPYGGEQSTRHMEKCWDAIAKTLSHMSNMLEQTTALVNSVEMFMNDDSKRPEVQDSITKTKTEMEDLCKAIQETAKEVEDAKHCLPDQNPKKSFKGPAKKDHLSVAMERPRSNSDSMMTKRAYISFDSPTLKLARKGKQAVMMMWSHKKEQQKKVVGSDSESNHSSKSSIESTSSSEDQERYVSIGTDRKEDEQGGNAASAEACGPSRVPAAQNDPVYDDPDAPDPKPAVRWYVNIPILSLDDSECAIQGDAQDSPHSYENVTFGPSTEHKTLNV